MNDVWRFVWRRIPIRWIFLEMSATTISIASVTDLWTVHRPLWSMSSFPMSLTHSCCCSDTSRYISGIAAAYLTRRTSSSLLSLNYRLCSFLDCCNLSRHPTSNMASQLTESALTVEGQSNPHETFFKPRLLLFEDGIEFYEATFFGISLRTSWKSRVNNSKLIQQFRLL